MSMTVSYYSFSPKRADEKWASAEGMEKISELKRIYSLSSGEISEEIREDLVAELIIADEELGGVLPLEPLDSVLRNESWLEAYCLEALAEAYSLALEDEVPRKEEWIRLFSELEADKSMRAIQFLAEAAELEISEAQNSLVSYLKEIRPVVEDLKNTPDSVFVRDYEDGNISPNKSVQILEERAKKRVEELFR